MSKRATIFVDDDLMEMLKEFINHERSELIIDVPMINGLLKTKEKIDITILSTDGDID